MIIAEQTFRRALGFHFRKPDRRLPSRWIEENIRLPPGYEKEPGPVSFAKTPFAREPLDCLKIPGVTDVLVSGPTRIFKTFLLRMGFCYKVGGEPGPMMLVDSTVPKGRTLVRKEFMPLVEYNPVLRARKPRNRHDYATAQMLFPGAPFNLFGANSEAQVAGETVEVVFGNEVAKWKGATEREAAILELVRHRTKSFEETRKHFLSSTPTIEDDLFWIEMLKGDFRLWFARCPFCAHFQALSWERVWWSPDARITENRWDLRRVIETARYLCENESCGGSWNDDERLLAVQHPESHWRPTKDADPGYRSYHITGLYGHRDANKLGTLAAKFLSARQRGFIADRQDFWNSDMGMVWKESVVEVTIKKLGHLERPYDRGAPPAGVRLGAVLIGFDVQTWGLPYVVRGFTWSGESWLIDHGVAPTWADMEAVQDDYHHLAPSWVIGDIQFEDRRGEVLEQIWKRAARGWLAAEATEFSRERVKVETANVFMGGKLQAEKHLVQKLVLSSYDFKRELHQRFLGEVKNWWLYSLPLQLTAEHQSEAEEFAEYKTQLLDERQVPRKRRRAGLPAFEWKSRRGNNHAFDCEVYILALFYVLMKKKSFARRAPPARRVIQVQR